MSANGFTKMSIYGMNMDLFSSSPIVILKVEDENRYLPIWIGQAEARSILFKLQNQEFVRPLTHDLALSLVNELGGSMERITVTELRDSTFFATIRLEIEGKTVEVDSRPSDAIALAIRSGAEIFASDEVIEEAGVVFSPREGMIRLAPHFYSTVEDCDRALDALVHTEATLVVLGEGPDRARLEERAEKLGLDSRVRFLGPQPRERVLELFRAADASLLSSSWENFPHTVVEALDLCEHIGENQLRQIWRVRPDGSGQFALGVLEAWAAARAAAHRVPGRRPTSRSPST